MRARSHHSTEQSVTGSDGDNKPSGKGDSDEKNKTNKSKPLSGIVTPAKVRGFILNEFNKYNKDKLNGIIRILSDFNYLKMCYLLIKHKPGNMTKYIQNETLDGIKDSFFEKISKELLSGSYNFNPSRRHMIPKKDGSLRPLGISSPREKIVHKALQMILECIYEPIFHDCSHGFRPKRSVHTALYPIYLKGHHHT
ncbi:MAG: hypothetical protein J6583_13700 [Gilliamella sp.]|nr:hypothetical protein [Gilliamella sp.]